ncbi:MAG: glycosyltransferase family 2 protein [Verrucomicrobia bacterium]|nr:glycosyltransferase family 2 protein [Verrucomicrobiota bacterium]
MQKSVDVSVLVTNYNHLQYLPECLEAIYNQSTKPVEVIVIDDASTDGSVEWIREYQKTQPGLVLLQNEANQGPAKTMNTAIRAARGKYVVLAAADDRVLPGIFEKGAAALDRHKEVGICCSEPTFFHDQKPYRFFRKSICREKTEVLMPAEKIADIYFKTPLWIPTHASLYRKELLLEYGCLDGALKHLCDWYLNCKIALLHGIVFIPESFGAFRLSAQSYGSTWNRSYRKKIELYKHLFAKLAQEAPSYRKCFLKSGVLGLVSADILIYLLRKPSLWRYFLRAFCRKTMNCLRKLP